MIRAFEPIAGAGCHLLVLGTAPSVRSLADDFYYAHPRNCFWPLLADIWQERPPETPAQKRELLLSHGVALWDVLSSCERRGSLDADIRAARPNDFERFFALYPGIARVLFNGVAAESLFRRFFPALYASRSCLRLPSTSPANAMDFARKREAWRSALCADI